MDKKNTNTEVIFIPKENRFDTERFIGVNGTTYLVKTGEPVEVPACVAEVINNSLLAQSEAAERQEELLKAARS